MQQSVQDVSVVSGTNKSTTARFYEYYNSGGGLITPVADAETKLAAGRINRPA